MTKDILSVFSSSLCLVELTSSVSAHDVINAKDDEFRGLLV